MRRSDEPARADNLLVDIETGTLLQYPPRVVVSRRSCEAHPFIEVTQTHVVAGPDATRVAGGAGGRDYVLYEIKSEAAGTLALERTLQGEQVGC